MCENRELCVKYIKRNIFFSDKFILKTCKKCENKTLSHLFFFQIFCQNQLIQNEGGGGGKGT